MKVHYRNQKTLRSRAERAQAIVEFALVLPILMMMLVGIFEVGRLIYTYAAVNNASREAARYGSAIGFDDTGTHLKYQYCDGIRNMARKSAYFMNLSNADIDIEYDTGPDPITRIVPSPFHTCAGSVDTSVQVNTGTLPDRVVITIRANYRPLINLIPIGPRIIRSKSARTIMGYLDVNSGTFSGSGGAPVGSVPTSTTAPNTAVPSSTLAATLPVNTPTATVLFASPTANVLTLTPFDTYTPTLTPTETLTPTTTFTPTMTFTPTATSTPVPGCNMITTGSISITNGLPIMSLTITNPHDSVTVLNVQATWNSLTGGPASKALALQSVSLAGVTWTVNNGTGSVTTTPPTTVTIPGNNLTSTITFTFDKNYQNKNNNESITINLSTIGCESYPIHKP